MFKQLNKSAILTLFTPLESYYWSSRCLERSSPFAPSNSWSFTFSNFRTNLPLHMWNLAYWNLDTDNFGTGNFVEVFPQEISFNFLKWKSIPLVLSWPCQIAVNLMLKIYHWFISIHGPWTPGHPIQALWGVQTPGCFFFRSFEDIFLYWIM